MSAWKELQLAIANGAEDIEEYERAWADECRRDMEGAEHDDYS